SCGPRTGTRRRGGKPWATDRSAACISGLLKTRTGSGRPRSRRSATAWGSGTLRLDRSALEGGALCVGDDARAARLLVARDEDRRRLRGELAIACHDRLACRDALRPEPLERASRDDDVVLERQLAPVVDLDPRDHIAPDKRGVLEHAAQPLVAHLLEVSEK